MARLSSRPTFVDLFAGAGLFSTGFIDAGMRPILAVDLDADAIATYRRNVASCAIQASVSEVRSFPTATTYNIKSMDHLDPLARSSLMKRVRRSGTTPELLVRATVTQLGYRYRLNRNDLPGKPDLAFVGLRKVIFVHGCFWHGHHCRRGCRVPATNSKYWRQKIERNQQRDSRSIELLRGEGWQVLVIWECQTRDTAALTSTLQCFLEHERVDKTKTKPRRRIQ